MYILDYKGTGCGGVNLPFDTIKAAIYYATERYATELTIRRKGDLSVALSGGRQDCRFRWTFDREVT